MTTTSATAATSSIRAEAARRNLSQRELAEHLGISQAALSRRMSGANPWDLDELDRLASLFGMDARDLIPERSAVS